jgi:hypothetical protein
MNYPGTSAKSLQICCSIKHWKSFDKRHLTLWSRIGVSGKFMSVLASIVIPGSVCRGADDRIFQSYVMTDGQSVSMSSPHLGPKNRFLLLSVAGLLMWGALSDERTWLSFTIASGPRQRSHSQVRVPRDLMTMFYCLRFDTPPTWRAVLQRQAG